MKYKIGDKIKYDGGDWLFYGTVSAVFEHSISPCYRIGVERMEKKSCRFSITQFEYELEACGGEVDSNKDMRKWEAIEIEYLKKYYGVLANEDLAKALSRSPQAIEAKCQQMISAQPAAAPQKAIEKPTRKRGEAWFNNLESYLKGEKNSVISTWVANNRRDYRTGKLSEIKIEKLLEINFLFETDKKKENDNWDIFLGEWKKGNRSDAVHLWKQKSVRQYTEGDLPTHRIAMLKEVGILK